jgi:hypothetical protein
MVLKIIALLAQLSPLVLYFLFFKTVNKIVELRVLFLYVFVIFFSNFLLGAFQNHGSLILSLAEITEYLFFSAIFFFCIQSRVFRKIIIIVTILNLCFDFFLFFTKKPNFDFWTILTTAILIFVYSIFFFYEQVNSPQILLIYLSHKFWIVVGCILYISGTLFVFLYTSDDKNKQNSSLWIINVAFEIVKNLFFSIAFIIARKSKENVLPHDFDDTNILEKPF